MSKKVEKQGYHYQHWINIIAQMVPSMIRFTLKMNEACHFGFLLQGEFIRLFLVLTFLKKVV